MGPNNSVIKKLRCININCLDRALSVYHLGLTVVCSLLLNIRWHKIDEIVLIGYTPRPPMHT